MLLLPTAKQLAFEAKHSAISDAVRIKHLTEAVYTLVQVVEDHDNTIRRIKGNGRNKD